MDSGDTDNNATTDDDPKQEQVVVTSPVNKGSCATLFILVRRPGPEPDQLLM